MITRIDITEALAALTGSAPDKTPKPSEIVIQAWAKYFDEHPSWTGDDLASAVYEYAKTPRERMVQPADLGDLIRGWQRDAYERMDPNERETAWGDLGGVGQPRQLTFGGGYMDAQGQRRDRFGFLDKSEPGIEYPQEWSSEQRRAAYWERVRTGFSNAPSVGLCPDEHPPGDPCADPDCDRPSTFGPFCARHYVQSKCAPFGIEIPL
jgi:hypothetical protein